MRTHVLTALASLALALAGCGAGGGYGTAPRPEPAIEIRMDYDRFRGRTSHEMILTDVPARARVSRGSLKFGAGVVTYDSVGTEPLAVIHFWAVKPLGTGDFTTFFVNNRRLIAFAGAHRIDRGQDPRTTAWSSEIRGRSAIHKATIQVELADLVAMAEARRVEGQVGGQFEFTLTPRHQEGLRRLLLRAGLPEDVGAGEALPGDIPPGNP